MIWIAPGQSRSFSQMYDIVDHIAAALRRHVEVAHPRIAFATPRGAAGLYGFLASIELGTCCPIDARLKEAELVDALVALAPDAVLLAGTEPAVLAAANHAGIPAIAFNLDPLMGECTVGHHAPRGTTRRAQRPALLLRGEETPAILMRTSGTTASPKLVGLSHANITAATEVMKEVFDLTPHDICLTPMPLYHVHGLIAGALSALSAGSSIHCNETFSPQLFDQALRDFSPSWLTAAPALHLAMCDFYSSGGRTPGISSLRRFRSSSAPLPPSSIALLEQLYDAPLLETYGLTETASTICSNLLPPRRRKPGSVGVPINTEMRSSMRRIGPPRQVSKARYCCAAPVSFRNISARRNLRHFGTGGCEPAISAALMRMAISTSWAARRRSSSVAAIPYFRWKSTT